MNKHVIARRRFVYSRLSDRLKTPRASSASSTSRATHRASKSTGRKTPHFSLSAARSPTNSNSAPPPIVPTNMQTAIDTLKRSDTPGNMPEIAATLTLPEKLSLIRRREGWTSDEAGDRWNIAGPTLRSYENGTRNPGKFAAIHLAKVVADYERKKTAKAAKGGAK